MDEQNLPPSSPYDPSPAPQAPPPLRPTGPVSQRPRKTNGWRIAAVVLAIFLILSLLSQFGMLVSSVLVGFTGGASGAGSRLEEVTVEANHSGNKIAIIPLEGLIFGGSTGRSGYGLVQYIEDQLKLAERDARVKAVILKINSPGGEVLASDEISRAIDEFQQRSGKPVVASMGSVAASGGYYVASPCRWIVAHPLTITGSIGVIMHSYNYRGVMNKIGVRPVVYKSGRFKDMLSGERDLTDLTPEEKATAEQEQVMIQRLIDKTFARFKDVVRQGRRAAERLNRNNASSKGRALAADWEDYVDGRVWSGEEAYEHGFVDEKGNWRVAVKRAQQLAQIADANLVQYQQPFDLGNFFRIFGKAEPARIQLDLGWNPPQLRPGLLYFVAPTYVR